MTTTAPDQTTPDEPTGKEIPEATQQAPPDAALELNLKKNPDSDSAKVDVGSDQSMDASDPVAVTAPGGNEPAPSSGFPDDK